MIKDLEEGLQLCGTLNEIKKCPALFLPIFTPSSKYEISADSFLERLVVDYSEQQSLRAQKEDVFKFFTDFILTLGYADRYQVYIYIYFTGRGVKTLLSKTVYAGQH